MALAPTDLRVEVVDRETSTADVGLAAADVIIAGGAGCDASSWHLIEELAGAIGGQVAASRSRRSARTTGPSGRPDRYHGAPAPVHRGGVSGALQHTVGMRSARTVLAINRDPDAFIFWLAHFGIVADVRDALPLLTARCAGLGRTPTESRAAHGARRRRRGGWRSATIHEADGEAGGVAVTGARGYPPSIRALTGAVTGRRISSARAGCPWSRRGRGPLSHPAQAGRRSGGHRCNPDPTVDGDGAGRRDDDRVEVELGDLGDPRGEAGDPLEDVLEGVDRHLGATRGSRRATVTRAASGPARRRRGR